MNQEVLTSISFELIKKPERKWLGLYGGICITVLLLLVWAAYAKIDVMIFATGKVIPSSEVKQIQHLEGGIVAAILIRPGQKVEAGELLLKIDNVTANSQLSEIENLSQGIIGTLFRLEAEITNQPLAFNAAFLQQSPTIARREKELYVQRQQTIKESLNSFLGQLRKNRLEQAELDKQLILAQKNIELMREELDLNQKLFEEDALSKVELLQLQRRAHGLKSEKQKLTGFRLEKQNQASRIQQQLDDRESQFINKAIEQRNELAIKQKGLLEKITAATDISVRSDVLSPVAGTVNQVFVNTVGGVVRPGVDLVEIVPNEDALLIEARINPKDIAFVKIGQRANVRLTAYDFALYGSLAGSVVFIGGDTQEERRDGTQYYSIHVKTADKISKDGEDFPVIPGMMANVDIMTGKRTILSYITKPIAKAQQRALREK